MTTERVVPIRPLLYTRLRLYLGGQAEYLGAVLDAEKDRLYAELDELRAAKAPEAEIEAVKNEIIHVVNARRDITTGLLDDRLEFLKVRVYRGGQADTLQEVLLAEQDAQLEELARLRATGLAEDDERIDATRARLHYLVNVLRDLGSAQIDLAGPNSDPR